MISFKEVSCKPDEMTEMTGYTLEEFNCLLSAFKEAVMECDCTLEGKKRKNRPVVYKNSVFPSITDQFSYFDIHEACIRIR